MGKVRKIKKELLSDNWYTLHKISFEYQKEDGEWEPQVREAYDRGNGAAILLYNQEKKQRGADAAVPNAHICQW